MKNRLFTTLAALVAALLLTSTAFGAAPGDIDAQNGVTLKDAILALQVCAGMAPQASKEADVDGDGQIGLEEALFVLRAVALESGSGYSFGDVGIPDAYQQDALDLSQLIADYDSLSDGLPLRFDWRDQGVVPPPKDQGGCGSCWAFASVGVMESRIMMETGSMMDLSEQQQISCNREMKHCVGGDMEALKFWSSDGPMEEACAQYDASNHPCGNFDACRTLPYYTGEYYTLTMADFNQMKISLTEHGPAYFRFDVYYDFVEHWNTALPGDVYTNFGSAARVGGHAVLLIGWDDEKNAWLCQNSYGATQGPNGDGTFWIAYVGHQAELRFAMATIALAKAFQLVSPNGGDLWEMGANNPIRWEKGNADRLAIDLLKGGTKVLSIAEEVENKGQFPWIPPLTLEPGSDYRVRVTDLTHSISDESDADFHIVNPLTVTVPNGGEVWQIGKTYSVLWDAGIHGGNVRINLYKTGEQEIRRLADEEENDGRWDWTIPETVRTGEDFRIHIQSVTTQTISDESDGLFAIALTPPENMTASDGTYEDRVSVSWDAVDGAGGYKVFRNTSLDANTATEVTGWQSGTVYEDTAINPEQTYYYWVKAALTFSGDGESGFSNSDFGYAKICDYTVSPQSDSFGASSGSGSLTVIAGAGCEWSASSNTAWITIDSGGVGTGNGTVAYSVSENDEMSERSGTLSVAGKTVSVAQAGKIAADEFTNSIGMMFRRIPAGTFMMGSPEGELGSSPRERPKHEVTLTQDYFMQTTEVTQAQWEAVMGSNPSYFSECGGNCPVEYVSWNDVQDFIAALNDMDEYEYRLPTEAEWEYAARAGTTTAFYNGGITETGCGVDSYLDDIGWYCGNSGVSYSGCKDASAWEGPTCAGTHPVAQKQPNAWGLYDMSGNVREWVQDWYGNYPENASVDPDGPSDGAYRVLRGGRWNFFSRYCRSAYRHYDGPTNRLNSDGFRLALSPGR